MTMIDPDPEVEEVKEDLMYKIRTRKKELSKILLRSRKRELTIDEELRTEEITLEIGKFKKMLNILK